MAMTVEEFRRAMAETEYIPAGSELHRVFHAFSQEALKITAELNGAYHAPEEIRALMSRLTAGEIDESFAMFPPRKQVRRADYLRHDAGLAKPGVKTMFFWTRVPPDRVLPYLRGPVQRSREASR